MIAPAAPHHLASLVELLARLGSPPRRGGWTSPNSEQRLPKRRTEMVGAKVLLRSAVRHALGALKNGLALIGFAAVCAGALVALDGDAFRRALPLLSLDAL